MTAQYVVFTKRAFNAIVTETLARHSIETGGIFLGYILDNGIWAVVEVVPPGIKTVNKLTYFEYDTEFVNYVANVIAKQYKEHIQVLGLWHRHPGSYDTFSGTDDQTNRLFAQGTPEGCGSISALVNCDPKLRLTMYSVDKDVNYTPIPWVIDDGDIIPENLLALRYEDTTDLPSPDLIQQTTITQQANTEHAAEPTDEKKPKNCLSRLLGR